MEAQRRYGVQTTLYFPLIDFGATDFEATPVTHASADSQVSKDAGAFANTTNAFAHEGNGIYSLVLTATEMEARVIVLTVKDQTVPKAWEDQCLVISTVGHASAEIPNLADGSVASAITKIDTVDDFLDTEIAAIKAKTDNLPADTAATLTVIDDFLDTEVAAIKAKTDLIPAAPAAVGDIPTAIQNADALLVRDVDNVEGSAPVHSLTSVILKLVSRFVASNGRTYRTNGSTVHMTQTPSTDPGADPVTELGVGA